MRTRSTLLGFLLLIGGSVLALPQASNPTIVPVATDPSGTACTPGLPDKQYDGTIYTCPSATHVWTAVGSPVGLVSGAQAVYLPYLDGSGTTLHDQSGNGYDCTFNGTLAWVENGTGILFGASSTFIPAYLNCPAAALTGAKTIEVVYRPTLPAPNDTSLQFAEYLVADDTGPTGVALVPSRDGMPSLAHATGSAGREYVTGVAGTDGITDAVFTCGATPLEYLGGALVHNYLYQTACPGISSTTKSYIGTAGGSSANQFSGTIYAVVIYPSVLSAAQILQNDEYLSKILAPLGVAFSSPNSKYPSNRSNTLILYGDSRLASAGTYYNLSQSRGYLLSRSMSDPYFWNFGISGSQLGSPDYVSQWVRNSGSSNVTLFIDSSINNIAAGQSAATVYSEIQSDCTLWHHVMPNTKIIYSTSVGYSGLTSAQEAERETLNSDVISGAIAGTFNCDGVNDIADDPILATQVVPNNFNPTGAGSGNPTWFTNVGPGTTPYIHETAAAISEISSQESFSVLAAQGRVNSCTVIDKKIPYEVLTAANTAAPGTTQTISLLQLFPGWQVCSLSSNVATVFSGTGISALTMSIGDSGGTSTQYQSAQDLLATGTQVSTGNTFTSSSGVVQMNFTATGGNLTALTSGEVDIQIGVIVR